MGDGLSLDYLVAGWPSPCDRAARSNMFGQWSFRNRGALGTSPPWDFCFVPAHGYSRSGWETL